MSPRADLADAILHGSAREISPWRPSRRATKRVANPLPAPAICRFCNGDVRIVGNEVIYGRKYGDWPWAYRCDCCGAYVGMHPFTAIPLGTLADKETREARKLAKEPFTLIWQAGAMGRSEAYRWLAGQMGIPVDECHFGWFDVAQCRRAQGLCQAYIEATAEALTARH